MLLACEAHRLAAANGTAEPLVHTAIPHATCEGQCSQHCSSLTGSTCGSAHLHLRDSIYKDKRLLTSVEQQECLRVAEPRVPKVGRVAIHPVQQARQEAASSPTIDHSLRPWFGPAIIAAGNFASLTAESAAVSKNGVLDLLGWRGKHSRHPRKLLLQMLISCQASPRSLLGSVAASTSRNKVSGPPPCYYCTLTFIGSHLYVSTSSSGINACMPAAQQIKAVPPTDSSTAVDSLLPIVDV